MDELDSATEVASKRKRPTATLKLAPVKGRPMLMWEGKRTLDEIRSYPAQLTELFDPHDEFAGRDLSTAAYLDTNLLLYGDNKEALANLLANGYRGQVNLIYIDPPFDSGADYVRRVQLRGKLDNAGDKLGGESYSLGEQLQYEDIWANDMYLQFMYERLILLKELLTENGSIFLHCDFTRSHYLRCLLDEVFGSDNFVNEIVWQHQIMGGSHDKRFPKAHETIFWYAKSNTYRLRSEDANVRVPFSEYVSSTMKKDEDGRWYYERRRMSRKATAEEAAAKAHTRTYVDNPEAGTVANDVWSDMLSYQELPNEREGIDLYPTQKTSKLLTRIISAASEPGDLVLDCFIGSGTTAAVAQKLGRRWIGCDINKGAIQTTAKRLLGIIAGQHRANGKPKQNGLPTLDNGEPPAPARLSFASYRVNNYDSAVQFRRLEDLAMEREGVDPLKTDRFFSGTLGLGSTQKLVKVVPFNYPLNPVDLEQIQRELAMRPQEERDIVVICLGKELSVAKWLKEWRGERGMSEQDGQVMVRTVPNDIIVRDMAGEDFTVHEPDRAVVSITRSGDSIAVKIEEFISPSIVQRLNADTQGSLLFRTRIPDWQAMVDYVLIDPSYDGQVFNVALSDVPAKKSDYVQGSYTLPAPAGPTTVAVKITDMLGEEVLVTKEV